MDFDVIGQNPACLQLGLDVHALARMVRRRARKHAGDRQHQALGVQDAPLVGRRLCGGAGGGTMHTARFAERQDRMLLCPRWPSSFMQREDFSGVRELVDEDRCTVYDGDSMPRVSASLRGWLGQYRESHGAAEPEHLF
jgi:hypothetical protein